MEQVFTLAQIEHELKTNHRIFYRRKNWNEEWIETTSPIIDLETFEYATREDVNVYIRR